MWSGRSPPTFQRNVLPPSSGFKRKPSKKPIGRQQTDPVKCTIFWYVRELITWVLGFLINFLFISNNYTVIL
jgi:hypothetical protein